jgi:threonine dehydratase
VIQRHVDQVRTVTDDAIIEALRAIAQHTKLVLEPAGAAAVAALLADADIERPVAAVLSGGNVDIDRLATWLTR